MVSKTLTFKTIRVPLRFAQGERDATERQDQRHDLLDTERLAERIEAEPYESRILGVVFAVVGAA